MLRVRCSFTEHALIILENNYQNGCAFKLTELQTFSDILQLILFSRRLRVQCLCSVVNEQIRVAL